MDSTPVQSQLSASKLPIKRKTPDPSPPPPDPIPEPIDGRTPPFKFHRIWTEPEEIRFLQGLLDCSCQNLAFPRDLAIFYARFSNTMSQPYTKSQLSEKLRRLRKKFRVISTRLYKGLDRSQLSLHDRTLYDLSKRLWHPDYASTSPFRGAGNVSMSHRITNSNNNNSGGGGGSSDWKLKRSGLVGIKVDFSPTLPVTMSGFDHDSDGNDDNLVLDYVDNAGGADFGNFPDEDNQNEEIRLSEVNVELQEEEAAMDDNEGNDTYGNGGEIRAEHRSHFFCGNIIGEMVAKVVMNVFDECFEDVRTKVLAGQGGERVSGESFQVRWQRQRIAELDILGSRLRLILEHSIRKD
ncbi:hypothetical protein OROGR_023858 [Orobanche gracilis]